MGLATIINMICLVCVPAWGHGAATLAWTLWWIDVVVALATNTYLPFAMYALALIPTFSTNLMLIDPTECTHMKLSFQQ